MGGVGAAGTDQLVAAAEFDDAAVLQHRAPVRGVRGVEPVGDSMTVRPVSTAASARSVRREPLPGGADALPRGSGGT
ncbi:hypothetical protein U2F26_12140 [Micromonospora sp. 4G57]|uniref:Uncharacterized protein n=1 Tax=Micromonospora sicca TaxID=2202420 RepID=A0ABU5J602_9ACTN|nr:MULTISPECIES: hypothetical protein [unclassified Micromonospora]MDZ5443479.1 hypothetical protein [Micromonospora sp. 4G57]MDZ5488021.1 hypothetical protein [Micromonospora sp. 4G53]